MDEQDYRLLDEGQIITPALIFYKDYIEENIQTAIQIAGDVGRLWPHIKTHKCADIVRMMVSHGIRKFKTATIAEAEMVAKCGAEQIILAYPLVGPNIERFLELQEVFPDVVFWAIGDDLSALRCLGEAAEKRGLRVNLLVDVDLGMGRTGVPAEGSLEFFRACATLPGVKAGGFHCYDGHFGIPDLSKRKELVRQTIVPLLEAQKVLRGEGIEPVLVMGGTPTFPCYAEYPDLYLSPGTCILNDASYSEKYQDMKFRKAAVVMTRVVSHPAGGRFTLDLGYKAIGADPQPPRGVIVGRETAYRTVVQNEEHWVLEPVDKSQALPPIGTVFYVVPMHICTTCLLYPRALVAEGGKVTGAWDIAARDRKLTI